MSGTNYDKICFITLKQAIDLRYPVCETRNGGCTLFVRGLAPTFQRRRDFRKQAGGIRGAGAYKSTSPYGRQIKSVIIEL
jgi:hypothetical protein